MKNEILSAKEIISLTDSILKGKQDDFAKIQLQSIKEEGYNKLTQKNLEFYPKKLKNRF